MAISSQGTTFTFKGDVYTATSVSVQGATPEIVDMTPATAAPGIKVLVPTGEFTSTGKIEVQGFGFDDPLKYVGQVGQAVFGTQAGTINRQVVCDSCSVSAQVGDFFRFSLTFIPTDYYP